jgi:hypothetical protein
LPTSMIAQPCVPVLFAISVLTWLLILSQFYLAYRSLCPNAWVMRWNDQREAGNFPVDLEH